MKNKNMTDMAVDALIIINRPMHYRDLTNYMIRYSMFSSRGKTPDATIASNIGTEIRRLGDRSRFVKVGKGIFGLNKALYPYFNETPANVIKPSVSLPDTFHPVVHQVNNTFCEKFSLSKFVFNIIEKVLWL